MENKKIWKVGEIRNNYPVLPKEERKTIVLLSDDIRVPSGVGTVSKEIVLGTCHYFNWVQIGSSRLAEKNKQPVNVNESTIKITGVQDPEIIIYPAKMYNNPDLLRHILSTYEDKIAAILHFTDPRSWLWLYDMEHEIRQNIPIIYYALWDELPYPKYNEYSYRSSNLIMSISKQSENIHKQVLGEHINKTKITYVPHGINSEIFKPVFKEDEEYLKFKDDFLKKEDYDIIFLYNNRNIGRKSPADLMIAYKLFYNSLPKEKAKKTMLLYHTEPIDKAGTNLIKVWEDLCPECNVKFSTNKLAPKHLNFLYNLVDVTMGVSSAEGFGLATAESLMAGTPIIINTTGGLQDQAGFVDDNGKPIIYSEDLPSNSCKRYTKCGSWAFPVWPRPHMIGSPLTPYIYDSKADYNDITNRMKEIYSLSKEKREEIGLEGRKFAKENFSSKLMCSRMLKDMTECIDNYVKPELFNLYKCEPKTKKTTTKGIWVESLKTWI